MLESGRDQTDMSNLRILHSADLHLDSPFEGLSAGKAAIRRGLQTDMATGTAYESEAFGLCFATEDQKDAMKAFLNKEKVTAFKNR